MNDNGILYQSLSIAIIVHLIAALLFSHTKIWTEMKDVLGNEPIVVDMVDTPRKTTDRMPPDRRKTLRRPVTVPVGEPKTGTRPPMPLPDMNRSPDISLNPPPDRPDAGPKAEDASERVSLPGSRTGPESPGADDGEYTVPAEPRRIEAPSAEDMMRYAKIEPDPARPEPENTITLDTDDLKYTSYMLGLKRRIEAIWQYPDTARRDGLQGELVIRFVIAKSGNVDDIEVVRSSGYPILDTAAVKALGDASPFNPLPDSWGQEDFQITGTFIYRLYGMYLR